MSEARETWGLVAALIAAALFGLEQGAGESPPVLREEAGLVNAPHMPKMLETPGEGRGVAGPRRAAAEDPRAGTQLMAAERDAGATLRGALLDDAARRDGPGIAARVAAAEAVHIGAGRPDLAAALHAYWAERREAGEAKLHALRALELQHAAGGARAALALFERLRPAFPRDVDLLDLGLALAEGSDEQRALEIARALVQLQPQRVERHRRLARVALWSGDDATALAELAWLTRRGGARDDVQLSARLARLFADENRKRACRSRRVHERHPACA
jgi:hypothetical protein